MPPLPELARAETRPTRPLTARRRTKTGAPDDRPDRGRAHPDAKLAQFALDPHAAPARILPRQLQHELATRIVERRPTRTPSPIRPLPAHQLPLPTHKRLRRN